jgi:AraC family transcriptional regulator, glycine betaine-responsive activator
MRRNIKIVLVPGFSCLSLGAILEPLHTLKKLYPDLMIQYELISISGETVLSESGVSINCQNQLQEALKDIRRKAQTSAVFLCCGLKTPFAVQSSLKRILRICNQNRIPTFGVGAAGWKMAGSGILSGGEGTVHWTTLAAFREMNQDILARDALFVSSDHITSSPGEAAALDMTISFIQKEYSQDCADQVCDHLMITFTRHGDLEQPKSNVQRLRDVPRSLQKVVSLMEGHLENPITLKSISATVGLSLRQIERLFSRHFNKTPKQYYISRRLLHARQLIEHTSLSIFEISLVSGFTSRQIFSKYYKKEFGYSPFDTRRAR